MKPLWWLLWALLWCGPVQAVTRPVATLPQLSSAIHDAQPGDVIELAPGVYRPASLSIPAGVTLRGPRDAVLDGSNDPNHFVHFGDYSTLEGVTVRGANGRNVNIGGGGPGDIRRGVVVRDCLIRDTPGQGVFTWWAQDVLIEGCEITENGGRGGANPTHGIYVALGCSDITIRGNEIHHNGDSGVHVNGNAGVARRVVVEGNYIHHNGMKGGDFMNAADCVLADNVLAYNTATNGRASWTFDSDDSPVGSASGCTRAVVTGNTVIHSRSNSALWLAPGSLYSTNIGAVDCVVRDNLVVCTDPALAIVDRGAGTELGRNEVYRLTDAVLADLFVDATNGDYRRRTQPPHVDVWWVIATYEDGHVDTTEWANRVLAITAVGNRTRGRLVETPTGGRWVPTVSVEWVAP